jgi:hypothetical protein
MASYVLGTGCLCYSCWTSDVQQIPRTACLQMWSDDGVNREFLFALQSLTWKLCCYFEILAVAYTRPWICKCMTREACTFALQHPRKSNAVTLPLWCLFTFDVVCSSLHLPAQSWLSVRVRVNALNLVLIELAGSVGVTKLWNRICPYTTWKAGFFEAQSLRICDWGIEQPSQNPKALCIFAPWKYHSKEFACICHLALTNHIWRMAQQDASYAGRWFEEGENNLSVDSLNFHRSWIYFWYVHY